MSKKLVVISIVILALAAGTVYTLRQTPDRIESVNAVVEGRLAVVSVSVPGTVKEVYVTAGEAVSRDQPLLALDASGYEARLANERGRLAEIASQLPPDLLVPAPGSRPASPGKPLEALRGEEEDARKKVETAAHVHAAANLALSRMDAGRPEGYSRTSPARQAALITRDEAAIALQKAKETYEKVSYARAQREVRDRVEKSGGPVSAALAARIAEYEAQISRVRLAERSLAATVLTSPENGRVALLAVRPGIQVSPGDAPVAVMPEEERELWVMAFFTPEDAAQMTEGRDCEIIPGKGQKLFKGILGRIPDAEDAEKNVAVRVILDQDTLPDGLRAGQPVSVSVATDASGFVAKTLDSILNKQP